MFKTVKELLEEYKASEGVKVCPKALPEEQETIINHDYETGAWSVYTVEPSLISKIIRENLLTSVIDVYYVNGDGETVTSLEGTLLKAPSMFSTQPRVKNVC